MTAATDRPAPVMTPIAGLRPAPWNPRRIKDARFQNLCRSLEADEAFLWLRPILATADGTVYAGNMRLRAAEHLGWTEVPAVVMDIPASLAKARAIRDNNGWGEWVDEEVGELLEELRLDGEDLELLGFDERELEAFGVGQGDEASGEPGEEATSLAERFGVPPFSVLDARQGYWQERKRAWLALGIESEMGRGEQLIPNGGGNESKKRYAIPGGAMPPAPNYFSGGQRERGNGKRPRR